MDFGEETMRLLREVADGEAAATDALFGRLYDELKTIASSRLRSTGRQSLQTTDLVHEAYVKMTRRPEGE